MTTATERYPAIEATVLEVPAVTAAPLMAGEFGAGPISIVIAEAESAPAEKRGSHVTA